MMLSGSLKKYILLLTILSTNLFFAQTHRFETREKFHAPEARQGVAVDTNYIYVIGSQQIAKYGKVTHELVNKWVGGDEGPIIHLDSGVIENGKLYCAHSNYPSIPMTSSIEIWDAESLKHIGSHSFGINWGSCTWVDKLGDDWYAAFAQYNKLKQETGKGTNWTVLIKFDNEWRFLESWMFPKEVIKKFGRMSSSGGSFGPDGLLYCTGHDKPELYVLKFPRMGSVMELVDILPIENSGQGIAWDRSHPNFITCINKKNKDVIIAEFLMDK